MELIEHVSTTDQRFVEVKNRFSHFFKEFMDYSNRRSMLSGNVKVSSNKANSYVNHLIRIILTYEKNNNSKIENLNLYSTFEKLNSIREIPDFKELNRKSSRFYSASLSEYERFIASNSEMIEEELDNIIEEELLDYKIENNQNDELRTIPEKRRKKVEYKGNLVYPRNVTEAKIAKQRAKWKCEVDPNHKTFTSMSGDPYVEMHHLVPMSYQDRFEYTIDFADNLIALCPNCHKLVHNGIPEERNNIINTLYENRKEQLKQHGIKIEFDELISIYDN